MLTSGQRALWEAYLAAERRGSRAEKLAALEQFVAELRNSPRKQWAAWAQSLVARIVDGGEEIPVRLPLFEHVLFPALMEGRRCGEADCTRWLSHFHSLLLHRPDCLAQLPEDERSPAGMLRAVLRQDPSNRRARESLIQHIADRFNYALHEVPTGVLYGTDGATEAECGLLLEELREFDRLVAEEGAEPTYGPLARRCRLHFSAYGEYLRSRDRYRDYDAYLEGRHPDWPAYE